MKAYHALQPKMILAGGGVMANIHLRAKLRKALRALGIPVYFPSFRFCTDNAAMIALAGYYKFKRGEIVQDPSTLDRKPSLTLEQA